VRLRKAQIHTHTSKVFQFQGFVSLKNKIKLLVKEKEKYQNKDFDLSYVETEKQVADMLTKSLPREAFESQRNFALGGPERQKSFPRAGR